MKKNSNLAVISLVVAAFAVVMLTLFGCSKPSTPPPAPASGQTNTHNMSPDDTVKTHMKQMQQNGGGGQ